MIWVILFVVLVALILGAEIVHKSEPLKIFTPAADPTEQEFTEYVARELHKAQVGAANAEEWALALVSEWRRRKGAV